jgi:hypothetical protein
MIKCGFFARAWKGRKCTCTLLIYWSQWAHFLNLNYLKHFFRVAKLESRSEPQVKVFFKFDTDQLKDIGESQPALHNLSFQDPHQSDAAPHHVFLIINLKSGRERLNFFICGTVSLRIFWKMINWMWWWAGPPLGSFHFFNFWPGTIWRESNMQAEFHILFQLSYFYCAFKLFKVW